MMRALLTSALLFLLPFALYAIYATVSDYLARQQPSDANAETQVGAPTAPVSAWQNPPIGWLSGVGVLLVFGTLIYLALTSGTTGRVDGTYHPPTVKDGKIQPGYVD